MFTFVWSVQAVGSGRNVCLVRVTRPDGVETGEHLFVSYCSSCKKGLPLHWYTANCTQCDRCISRRQRNRAQPGSRPHAPRNEEAMPHPYADREHPLLLQPERETVTGQCAAAGCFEPVQRVGDMRNAGRSEAVGKSLKLCPVHSKVLPASPPLSRGSSRTVSTMLYDACIVYQACRQLCLRPVLIVHLCRHYSVAWG